MARTTPELVKTIVTVDDDSIDLTAFIQSANELVTELCAPKGLSDTRLELIERWLAAHFFKIFNPATASEQAGTVQETFQYRLGLVLQNTMWGQQAIMLDTSGELGLFSKNAADGKAKATIGVTYLGVKPCTYP